MVTLVGKIETTERQRKEKQRKEKKDDGNKVLIIVSSLIAFTTLVTIVLVFYWMRRQGRLQRFFSDGGDAGDLTFVNLELQLVVANDLTFVDKCLFCTHFFGFCCNFYS